MSGDEKGIIEMMEVEQHRYRHSRLRAVPAHRRGKMPPQVTSSGVPDFPEQVLLVIALLLAATNQDL